jgi:predicted P-loop ATPase
MTAFASAFQAEGQFQRESSGAISRNSQFNICLALSEMGITLTHDVFSDRLLITEGGARPKLLDDAAVNGVWLRIDSLYRFRPERTFFFIVLQNIARQAAFHPVQNYLKQLVWDGQPRLSRWLTIYGGAEDSEYTRAVGRLPLTAAVRRAFAPGTKFDEMLVLEGPQGVGQKSSALAALCPEPSWFSDDLPLGSESKEVIERTNGKWIVEASELTGMSKRDADHLKAFLGRSTDIARLAYDRTTSERPRSFIVIGTTNSRTYLKDGTGNRRYWPVPVTTFDLAALVRDRDQIWAEAVTAERMGESIRLDKNLWPLAAVEQEERRLFDPWEELIAAAVGDRQGKVPTDQLWQLVGLSEVGRRTTEHNNRLGAIMQGLGFVRKKARSGGSPRYHYLRGTPEERQLVLELAF